MEHAFWITYFLIFLDVIIVLTFTVRIIMQRAPISTTFAWLTVLLIFPIFGSFVYLLFGELRLGNRRAEWAKMIHKPYQKWLTGIEQRHAAVDWSKIGEVSQMAAKVTRSVFGVPVLKGNRVELLVSETHVFERLIEDIHHATSTCHLEFYIWHNGGRADEVTKALVAAAKRGVRCRVLLDHVGSSVFLGSEEAERMRGAGVDVRAALPVGLFRMLFYRLDLRLHRKIVVIDGKIAYTGSMNMADPLHFKREDDLGPWVDALMRIEGPTVEALAVTFLEDWQMESSEETEALWSTSDAKEQQEKGTTVIQAIPSGPIFERKAVQHVLLMTIYSARRQIILTSPYFVPDELLATALLTATRRGVEVILIIPEKVDSAFVRYASQAYWESLLEVGVKIARYRGGLLHTKSVTVDEEFCLFGSLNLDARSLHLNFEITLAIYDREVTQQVRELQYCYLENSFWMDLSAWQSRPARVRFKENLLRLLSPLL